MEPVVIKRVFPCSKRRLFDAWSTPSLMAEWFFASEQPLKKSTVRNSFTVGGPYEVIMHLQTGEYRMHGEYREINRYNRIAFTWSSHIVTDSRVQLDFRAISPNRTKMTLTHTQFPDEMVRGRHVEGWDRCLANLAHYLADGVASA